ncbi:MAG: sulfatase-like hydrolase/transferase [Clostridia bacterium]
MLEKKKNVLFIMSDQLKYAAIGAHGNQQVLTPNLDHLARSGCDVENFFTNSPVCVPSRCTFITGKYLHAHHIRENHTVLEENREIHLFRMLKQEGYLLSYSGKNHVLIESEFENFDFASIDDNRTYSSEERLMKDELKKRSQQVGSHAYQIAGFHDFPKEATPAWNVTTSMIDSLESMKDVNRPFCAFLSIVEPHYPHVAPKEIWDMYEGVDFEIPLACEDDLPNKASRFIIKQKAQHSNEASLQEKKKWMRAYYSLITLVDMQVGRIVDWLQANDKLEDTIIVFTSDHGEFGFEHGMNKKDLVLLDCLLHVPLMISWKGKIAPQTLTGTLAEQVDVLPTILDLLGVSSHRGVQGKSFAQSLLTNTKNAPVHHKDAVFAEVNPPWLFNTYKSYEEYVAHCLEKGIGDAPFNIPGDFTKSIRTKEHRYIWYGNGEEELYEFINDPGETKNLALDPAYKDLKLNMKLQLLEWNALSEDPVDPSINARLQRQYSTWIGKNEYNYSQWLPYWMLPDYKKSLEKYY